MVEELPEACQRENRLASPRFLGVARGVACHKSCGEAMARGRRLITPPQKTGACT